MIEFEYLAVGTVIVLAIGVIYYWFVKPAKQVGLYPGSTDKTGGKDLNKK